MGELHFRHIGQESGKVARRNPMTEKKLKENTTAKQFIKECLRLIEEKGGIKGVNMRTIARNIGCAHTNAYNYFSSLEDLLSHAVMEALQYYIDFSKQHLDPQGKPIKQLETIFENQIDFAIKHKGLYRFIWVDELEGDQAPELLEFTKIPGKELVKALQAIAGNSFSLKRMEMVKDVLHGYLHGEICKLLFRPVLIVDLNQRKKQIVNNIKMLFSSLTGLQI
jgi:AcrR family transcriptional regulator